MKIICPKSADFKGYYAVNLLQGPLVDSKGIGGRSNDSNSLDIVCQFCSGAKCQNQPSGSRLANLSKSD